MLKINKFGFSLVDTFISIAIFSTLSLMFSGIALIINKRVANQKSSNDFQNIYFMVNSVISNNRLCNMTFTDKPYNPSSLPQDVSNRILLNGTHFSRDVKFGDIIIKSVRWVPPEYVIESFSDGSKTRVLNLEIKAGLKLDNQEISKIFKLIATTDATNKIKNCLSSTDANYLCDRLGGLLKTNGLCALRFPVRDDIFINTSCDLQDEGMLAFSGRDRMLICMNSKYIPWALLPSPSPSPSPSQLTFEQKCRNAGGTLQNTAGGQFCVMQARTQNPVENCPTGMSYVPNWTITQCNTCNRNIFGGPSPYNCTTSCHSNLTNIDLKAEECYYGAGVTNPGYKHPLDIIQLCSPKLIAVGCQ